MTRPLLFFVLAAVLLSSAAVAQAPTPGEPATAWKEPMYALMSRAPVIALCVVTEGTDVAVAAPGADGEEAVKPPLRPTASCKVVRAFAGIKEGETIVVSIAPGSIGGRSVALKTDEQWLLFTRAQQRGQYSVVRAGKVVEDTITGIQIEQSDIGLVVTDGDMPLEKAVAAITKAIDDHAAAAKYDVGAEAKTDAQLLADIGDNDELNLKIVRALAARKACPQLLQLVETPRSGWNVQLTAIYGVGQCPGQETEDALIGLLKSEDKPIISGAARSLAALKSKRALEPLLEAAQDQEGVLPFEIARALAATGDPRVIEPLLDARERTVAAYESAPGGVRHPWLRAEYLRLLGQFDDPRVAELARQELKSGDRTAVLVAADILHRRGDPGAVRQLVALLEEDTSYANQSLIISKLKDLKAIEGAPALIKLLEAENIRIRKLAANALVQIAAGEGGCPGCGEDAAKWQDWWDKREGG